MKKYKVTLQYDGHNYLGWQSQKDTGPTVQDVFNLSLKKIYKVVVKTIGSGRTDSGVHCLAQHVVFSAPFEIHQSKLVKAINANLPADIRAIDIEIVSNDFRPTNDAISREYRYLFTNLEQQPVFHKSYVSNISYRLDFDLMREACLLFEGKHDFGDFYCVGSDVNSTVREIFKCELLEKKVDMHGIFQDHYFIKVIGSGFMKQMIRLIVGTIWNVGQGKVTLDELKNSLLSPSGKHLAAVAPAVGLYKISVEYP
jgi:tRNA pseudouridine38-40 synthase